MLIVEDNPAIAAAVEMASEQLNFGSDVAIDGWDAIELLRTGRYAGIIIDADVPHRSGFGVIRYLREESAVASRKVLVMTSGDRETVRHRVDDELQVIRASDSVDVIAAAMREVFGEV